MSRNQRKQARTTVTEGVTAVLAGIVRREGCRFARTGRQGFFFLVFSTKGSNELDWECVHAVHMHGGGLEDPGKGEGGEKLERIVVTGAEMWERGSRGCRGCRGCCRCVVVSWLSWLSWLSLGWAE